MGKLESGKFQFLLLLVPKSQSVSVLAIHHLPPLCNCNMAGGEGVRLFSRDCNKSKWKRKESRCRERKLITGDL